MIPEYRERFNKEFSNEKYRLMLDILAERGRTEPKFRVAESPVFLPKEFQEKLHVACGSIIEQIKKMPAGELQNAIPDNCRVPNDTAKPHFLTIDFGICATDEGEIIPQLIELQAFPTLYGFQRELQTAYCEVYPFLCDLRKNVTDEEYYSQLRKLIVGDENPENVILLEIFPHQQKTNIDFYITEEKLGIKTVCLTEVTKEGKSLFYNDNGKKTQIHRIYNRVIFDELDAIPDLKLQFDFREYADVTWVTHPNWFFKISKYLLPVLKSEFIPKSYFLSDFPQDEDPAGYVLKPLFSFAGSGVNLEPTREILNGIEDKENYIMQKKVVYAPLFKDINGEFSKGEIRMLYIWQEDEEEPRLMEHLIRLTKVAMVNVDFNRKDAIWIGGSTAFFEK